MSEHEGFSRRVVRSEQGKAEKWIDHGSWLRARAEGGFVGTCRRCGDYLVPRIPDEHGGRIDYEADCRNEACRYTIMAPGGRVFSSAVKSLRSGGN
jgi:hypothetical protein